MTNSGGELKQLVAQSGRPGVGGKGCGRPPRRMDEFGRPTDMQPIEPGDRFVTFSGRETTPYPASKGPVASDRWLIANAIAEAQSRGDEFNVTVFGSETATSKQPLPTASVDSMLLYLFVWQPAVVAACGRPVKQQNREDYEQ